MLAKKQISNTESIVYICPENKTAVVKITVVSVDGSEVPITIKLGDETTDLVFWSAVTDFIRTDALWLTSGDVIKVKTTGTVNVFVDGKEN
jgi:hypothetical protein